jgi:stearoyl-CoA desaturase (delta-9 desaturase)
VHETGSVEATATTPSTSAPSPSSKEVADDRKINWGTSAAFFFVHFFPLMAIWTGVTWTAVAILVVTYYVRVLCITAGYHRYFSHRTYRLSRVPQFLLAFGALTASQKGPLWWAAHHRHHHRYSDTDVDIHSPKDGFVWSHMGWILCDRYNGTDLNAIRDFARFPELRFLNDHDWIGPWALGAACFLIGGWSGLFFGFFLSTILLWHGTFLVNSLAHVMGRRRFETNDTSKNSFLIAFVTAGEGWHNNHHRYQTSARQGFYWWQFDPTWYLLRVGEKLGIVKDLRRPPKRILDEGRGLVAPPGAGADLEPHFDLDASPLAEPVPQPA